MENLLESTDPRGQALLSHNSYMSAIQTYTLKLQNGAHVLYVFFFDDSDIAIGVGNGFGLLSKIELYPE